jgi:hypothetical protein
MNETLVKYTGPQPADLLPKTNHMSNVYFVIEHLNA